MSLEDRPAFLFPSEAGTPPVLRMQPCIHRPQTHTMSVRTLEFAIVEGDTTYILGANCNATGRHYILRVDEDGCKVTIRPTKEPHR